MSKNDKPVPFDGELGLDSGADTQDPEATVHRDDEDTD